MEHSQVAGSGRVNTGLSPTPNEPVRGSGEHGVKYHMPDFGILHQGRQPKGRRACLAPRPEGETITNDPRLVTTLRD